jgi:hypothetical protein
VIGIQRLALVVAAVAALLVPAPAPALAGGSAAERIRASHRAMRAALARDNGRRACARMSVAFQRSIEVFDLDNRYAGCVELVNANGREILAGYGAGRLGRIRVRGGLACARVRGSGTAWYFVREGGSWLSHAPSPRQARRLPCRSAG